MPSNHIIIYRPLLLLFSIFPCIRVLSNESGFRIMWWNYWSFSFSISLANEYSCGPITSWQIDGETMETVADNFFRLQNHCRCWLSHEIKRHSLLGRKVMTNLDSILKSRDIILPAKIRLVKAVVFPVVVYGCESWTIKKGKCWRIDPFDLWCWRRLLRVPWTARRSNQSIFRMNTQDCSLEGLMLKLKLQYFGHLMWRSDSFEEKDPDAGKDWGQEKKGTTEDEMILWHHRLNGHDFE